MTKMQRGSIKTLQSVFLAICVVFIVKLYFEEKENIDAIVTEANWMYLLLSILLWTVVNTISPLLSFGVLRCQKRNVAYSFLLEIFFRRLPAKYLPGGIWHTVARFHDLSKMGVQKKQLVILAFYENFWSAWIAALIGGGGVYYFRHLNDWGFVALLMLGAALLAVFLLVLLKRMEFIFSLRCYLRLTAIGLNFWLFASASFYFYTVAFDLLAFGEGWFFIAVNYMFSWLVGFVSVFAPQGIGVFEVVFVRNSEFSVSMSGAVVIIAGFRVVVLLADLASYLVVMFVKNCIRWENGVE